jgi:hypothetical protein
VNFRDAYEFDPETYGNQAAGGLLGRLRAIMQQQSGADPGSNIAQVPPHDPDTYVGQQGGLLGRLLALQQQQGEYQPRAAPTTQSRSSLTDQIVRVESRGNPNAVNDLSTATGPGQFLEGTWLDMLRRHRPDLTGTREQLLALRRDPQLAREMTEAYAADNARRLSRAGHEATPGNTYLAHFAGPTGAVSILNADPNASVRSVLGNSAIESNPFLANMTVGDIRAWADRKMAGKVARPSAPAPPVFPERAEPVFPWQAAPQPVRRLVRR